MQNQTETKEGLLATLNEVKALEAKIVAKINAIPKAAKKLTFKVSQAGAVSVYGLGRFPVTLYANQWERLFGCHDELLAFIASNRDELATK